jgi:hypothetical protein
MLPRTTDLQEATTDNRTKGGHCENTINGKGTVDFLHKHLDWPQRGPQP